MQFLKEHKVAIIFLVIAAVLVSTAVLTRLNGSVTAPVVQNETLVTLASASDYQHQKTIDAGNGTVESLGQADLKSQLSAPITQVNVKLGDNVAVGQVLVQLQNNDIKAQLEQAQAGLTAAESRLDELKRGSRSEELAISQTAAKEAQTALVNSIKDAYAKSDDSIHNHIDKFFNNPRENSAKFVINISATGLGQSTFQSSDVELSNKAGRQKYALEALLNDWQVKVNSLNSASSAEEIKTVLNLSKTNLQTEIDFMNTMAPLVNNLTTENSTYKQIIDGYKTEFSAARSTVSGSLAALQGAETSWQTAVKGLDLKLAGSSDEQIKQGQAAVSQAQASVDALKANLAKTAIVSPIAGKISYISGNVGELTSPGQLVASVVNPGALKIKVYVSESDLQFISEKDSVAIDGNAQGTVQTISPAVNAQTKKAEVNILVTKNSDPAIVVGENVSVKIASAKLDVAGSVYLLPIEAVQFADSGNFVFTVDQDSKVKAIPVVTGEIVGENVYVNGGLEAQTKILTSVRGLEAGEIVKVK